MQEVTRLWGPVVSCAVSRLIISRVGLPGLLASLIFCPVISAETPVSRQVTFRERSLRSYTIIEPEKAELRSSGAPPGPAWIEARDAASNRVALGNRIVLQVVAGGIEDLLAAHQLTLARTVRSNLFIL